VCVCVSKRIGQKAKCHAALYTFNTHISKTACVQLRLPPEADCAPLKSPAEELSWKLTAERARCPAAEEKKLSVNNLYNRESKRRPRREESPAALSWLLTDYIPLYFIARQPVRCVSDNRLTNDYMYVNLLSLWEATFGKPLKARAFRRREERINDLHVRIKCACRKLPRRHLKQDFALPGISRQADWLLNGVWKITVRSLGITFN
jgi:hypothetical protein